MITFIIPVIHPKHKKVKNYHNILIYLERTIKSIINIEYKTSIIVIIHSIPNWGKKYKNVNFIEVNANILNILRKLDDKSSKIIQYKKNPFYLPYLEMPGKFHNKDKGIKYFIGLLYLSLLPKKNQPKYVGLIDADDFIHQKIGIYLDNCENHYNQILINKGYILHGKGLSNKIEVNSIYPIEKYSSICGSNRFFKYNFLEEKIKLRLIPKFSLESLNLLYFNKIANNKLFNEIIININTRSQVWNILPTFLGIHRVYLPNKKYTNQFHKKFKITYLSQYAGVKFIHDSNHSSGDKSKNFNEIINRYIQKKIIKFDEVIKIEPILKKFNIS